MLSTLPPAEHTQVVNSLRTKAADVTCQCGNMKPMHRAFCIHCCEIFLKTDMTMDLRLVNSSMLQPRDHFEWLRYELLLDAYKALKSGLWNTRAKKRSLEDPDAWS